MSRSVGAVLAWVAAVVVATLVGVLAVGAIGSGILPRGQEPLSPEDVRRELAGPAPTTSRPGPPSPTPTTSTPTPPESAPIKVLSSPGGKVYARCNPAVEGGVEVTSWVPEQGYHFKDDEPEDGGRRVRFESGDDQVDLSITCDNGVLRSAVERDDDDEGNGDD